MMIFIIRTVTLYLDLICTFITEAIDEFYTEPNHGVKSVNTNSSNSYSTYFCYCVLPLVEIPSPLRCIPQTTVFRAVHRRSTGYRGWCCRYSPQCDYTPYAPGRRIF